MKILIATRFRDVVGGAETYLRALIPVLLERGHRLALLCDHDCPSGLARIDPAELGLPVWFTADLRHGSGAWTDLNRWGPELVYSQGLEAHEVDQALQERYPVIMFAHSYWGTCATGSKCHALPRLQVCERTFGPMCLILHYPRRCGGLNPVTAWNMYRTEKARNSRLTGYRAILVASNWMRAEFLKHGVSADKVRLVRLPLTEAAGGTQNRTPSGRLLFVGRLTDVKGVDVLIASVSIAERLLGRKLVLTIAGDGPELSKLQAQARKQTSQVEFLGWVSGSRRRELMSSAELLVVPSLWPEPFGMVGIEAGSLGLPAVGFAVGGIPDWLIAGGTGELAPANPPSPQGLAEAIARALAKPDHYRQLCEGAREMSRLYSMEQHVTGLEQIWNSCVVPVSAEVAVSHT